MEGTVTISLKDFDELRHSQEKVHAAKKQTIEAAKELGVFLTFLGGRGTGMEPLIVEFNRQSKTARIVADENSRYRIELLDLE
tara:strand:+ start:2497 stop:2745 length:249 start_codon:yes stop_codon:yes gene_type:complete